MWHIKDKRSGVTALHGLYAGNPASIQRRNWVICSWSHSPSHGIVPSVSRSRMSCLPPRATTFREPLRHQTMARWTQERGQRGHAKCSGTGWCWGWVGPCGCQVQGEPKCVRERAARPPIGTPSSSPDVSPPSLRSDCSLATPISYPLPSGS